MSVNIENSVSIENIRFINSDNVHGLLDGIERKITNSAQNSEIKSRYFDKFIRRINGFYTWKIPWIVILISILQVFEKWCIIRLLWLIVSLFWILLNRINCFYIQIVVFFVACNDWIAILTFNPRKKHELWRFFTYYTVHFSLTHLLLNVILQVKPFEFKFFFLIFKPSPLQSKSFFKSGAFFFQLLDFYSSSTSYRTRAFSYRDCVFQWCGLWSDWIYAIRYFKSNCDRIIGWCLQFTF